MIDHQKTIELLLAEFPDFKPCWVEHIKHSEGQDRSVGMDIDVFSDFISEKLEKNESYDFDKAFILIEKLMVEGDERVHIAAATMFLENLINLSSHGDFPIESFWKYLKGKSLQYSEASLEFWKKK